MNRLALVGFSVVSVALTCAIARADNAIIELNPSGGDDQPQIQSALDVACANGNTDVVLRNGTYNLSTPVWAEPEPLRPHLSFNDCHNVGLRAYDGEVASLIYLYMYTGIKINGGRDIRLENLTFDWFYHPYGQGTVYAIDPDQNLIWIANDSGYATWDNPIFFYGQPSAWQYVYLTRTQRGNTHPQCDYLNDFQFSWGSFDNWLNWFIFDPARSNCPAGLHVGDKVVLNRNSWTTNGIHMIGVSGAMLRNLTFYAAPGNTILNERSDRGTLYEQINLINVNILYHPSDSSRTLTANGNGFHSTGSRAAFYIANSTFYGQGDDAIDFHDRGAYLVGLSYNGAQWDAQFRKNFSMDRVRKDDILEVFNPKAGQFRCNLTADDESRDCGTSSGGEALECVLVKANPCSPLTFYTGSNGNTSDWIVNTAASWDALTQTPSTLENNSFFGSRGRAILNRGWNTIIRNNDIGDWYYGRPNFGEGIYEGICDVDLDYGPAGRWNWPTRDGQQIYGNTGVYGDRVSYCISSSNPLHWPY